MIFVKLYKKQELRKSLIITHELNIITAKVSAASGMFLRKISKRELFLRSSQQDCRLFALLHFIWTIKILYITKKAVIRYRIIFARKMIHNIYRRTLNHDTRRVRRVYTTYEYTIVLRVTPNLVLRLKIIGV